MGGRYDEELERGRREGERRAALRRASGVDEATRIEETERRTVTGEMHPVQKEILERMQQYALTSEVREIYDALVKETTAYCDAKAEYERLRERLIREIGYDAFRDRQREAMKALGRVGVE